jgi:malonate transporter and related proteins
LRLPLSTSAVAALVSSSPAAAEIGPAILGGLFPGSSAVPIAIAGLIIVLVALPVTILFLEIDATEGDSQKKILAIRGEEHSPSPSASRLSMIATRLTETVKQPIVWAPVLAFVIVLIGGRIPQVLVHSLSLLGHASGGVALFSSGIVLASGKVQFNRHVLLFVILKNIVQPALVLGGLRWLGYGNPIVSEAVLTIAIPSLPIAVMLAFQYRVAEAAAASAVFLSVIGSVFTMGIFIALTS